MKSARQIALKLAWITLSQVEAVRGSRGEDIELDATNDQTDVFEQATDLVLKIASLHPAYSRSRHQHHQ
jgi:hypothetical protein